MKLHCLLIRVVCTYYKSNGEIGLALFTSLIDMSSWIKQYFVDKSHGMF